MIRRIRGTVLATEPLGAVIDVGGWGILVAAPAPETFSVGSEVTLMTHLAVKQDGVELYGFESAEDLRFFELLLTVSGIGPKTAMNVLRKAPRMSLEEAIGKRDVNYLTRVVGLGKKSAEKLIVEIGENMGTGTGTLGDDTEVVDTLVALGYTEREARKAVHGISPDITGKDARLRAALGTGA